MPPPMINLYPSPFAFGLMKNASATSSSCQAQPTNDLEYYLQAMSENMKLHSKVRKLEEELAIERAKKQ